MVVQFNTLRQIAGANHASKVSVSFHVVRDPEFLQGIQDGRQMLPENHDGWVSVQDLLQFLQTELPSPIPSQELPIYNLGLVAGLFGSLADLASPVQPGFRRDRFRISHPHFLAGLRIGADLFEQDYAQALRLTDSDLSDLFHTYLTPFESNVLTNTGICVGFLRAFQPGDAPLAFPTADFLRGYQNASTDWKGWNKAELLTDVGFAQMLAVEVSPKTRRVMQEGDPGFTETYQMGYVWGLVSSLLDDPFLELVELPEVSAEV